MSEDNDGVYHDEVEIEDFEYDIENQTFSYPCPCGDLFTISREDLLNGEDIARCASCSLIVRVIFNVDDIDSLCEDRQKQKQTNNLLITN